MTAADSGCVVVLSPHVQGPKCVIAAHLSSSGRRHLDGLVHIRRYVQLWHWLLFGEAAEIELFDHGVGSLTFGAPALADLPLGLDVIDPRYVPLLDVVDDVLEAQVQLLVGDEADTILVVLALEIRWQLIVLSRQNRIDLVDNEIHNLLHACCHSGIDVLVHLLEELVVLRRVVGRCEHWVVQVAAETTIRNIVVVDILIQEDLLLCHQSNLIYAFAFEHFEILKIILNLVSILYIFIDWEIPFYK